MNPVPKSYFVSGHIVTVLLCSFLCFCDFRQHNTHLWVNISTEKVVLGDVGCGLHGSPGTAEIFHRSKVGGR